MSNRTNSKLVRGYELMLGGTTGYGPPYQAANVRLKGTSPGANDAVLELEGDLTVRDGLQVDGNGQINGNLTIIGNIDVQGTSTLEFTQILQGEDIELLGSTTIGDAADVTGPSGDILTIHSPTTIRGADLVVRQGTTIGSPVSMMLTAASGEITANRLVVTDIAARSPGTQVNVLNKLQVTAIDGVSIRGGSGTEGWRQRVLKAVTTNATLTEMNLDGAGLFLTLATGAVHSYTIIVTAKGTSGPDAGKARLARYDFLARNVAGTVAIIGNVLETIISEDPGLTWSTTIDATSDRVTATVGGEASSGVTWVGRVTETAI